jgi:hypothetical protein
MTSTKTKTSTKASTNTTTTEENGAAHGAAQDLFGDRLVQAAPRAYFTADCDGTIAGVAFGVTSRQVADPNKPGATKTLRSLVVRLTRACQGKRQDEEIDEIPAGGEIELTVSSALERLAENVAREPHGVVLVRGEKRKTPRGFQRTNWDVQALPMRLCRGISKELAEELTAAHAALRARVEEPAYPVAEETEEAPF